MPVRILFLMLAFASGNEGHLTHGAKGRVAVGAIGGAGLPGHLVSLRGEQCFAVNGVNSNVWSVPFQFVDSGAAARECGPRDRPSSSAPIATGHVVDFPRNIVDDPQPRRRAATRADDMQRRAEQLPRHFLACGRAVIAAHLVSLPLLWLARAHDEMRAVPAWA